MGNWIKNFFNSIIANIVTAIILATTFGVGLIAYFSGWLSKIPKAIKWCFSDTEYFWTNYTHFGLIFILSSIILFLIYDKIKIALIKKNDKPGLQFVKKWKLNDYKKFKFLFWFIHRNTLKSNASYKPVSDIPEVRILLDKKVISVDYYPSSTAYYEMPIKIFNYLKTKNKKVCGNEQFIHEDFMSVTKALINKYHIENDSQQ